MAGDLPTIFQLLQARICPVPLPTKPSGQGLVLSAVFCQQYPLATGLDVKTRLQLHHFWVSHLEA